MRALLLKDVYMMMRYHWSMMLICLVFFGISIFGNGNIFFEVYPLIFAGLIPTSLIAYDEQCGWISYCAAMPFTRKQYVSEKYLCSAMIFLIILILVFISHTIRAVIGSGSLPGTDLLLAAAGCLAAPTVTMPLIFKLGSEKGRLAYISAAVVICALLPIYFDENTLAGTVQLPLHIAAMLLSVLLFAASWLLSVHLFETREL